MTQQSIAAKVRWRLGVPCVLFMLMSSLDRANVSFAAATMNAELGFTPSQYGFGAGVLFVGFLAGQYPSLYLLQRIGMRGWIAACALLWGLSAGAMAFIQTHAAFYVLRVLIGFAEGGLAPGIVYYLTQFATERERASTFSLPMIAIPLSVILGAPLSGWLLGMQQGLGMSGWRFMYLAEALPTVILGLLAGLQFPNTPDHARWLTDEERHWLARNAARRNRAEQANDWSVLGQPVVLLSGLLWFCLLSGSYGVIFWLPQVIGSLTALTPVEIGLAGALPWVGVAAGIYFNAAHSDRTGERFWHVAVPSLLAAAALIVAWLAGPGSVAALALVVAGLGLGGAQGAFWAVPTRLLAPAAMGVAVVAINILGSAGGLVMPPLMGIARERSGSFAGPTWLVVGVLATAALLVAAIRLCYRREIAALDPASATRSTGGPAQ
jgi:ACS family tartrate transporter-like MFS transporter